MSGITKPFLLWCADERISRTKGAKLLAAGEVDTTLVMGRRVIFVSSWLAYLARRAEGRERDPVEKAKAAQTYRRTADEILARQGRQLTRGSARESPTANP